MLDCCKSSWSWWLWMGGSITFAVIAVYTALSWNEIFNALLSSLLVLSPGTQTFQRWKAPDQPLLFEVFLFNWTNADRFPEKPKLEQLGPYSFREIRKHVNITVHSHNSSIAYRTQRSWYFDELSSNGTLEDIFTSIDMVAASAVFKHRYQSYWSKVAVSWAFTFNKLSVTKTVREMLFEGYENGLLTLGSMFMSTPGMPKMDRFGWFYPRNNSMDTDGYMEVSSGADGTPLGQILKWNHNDTLPYYQGSCSRLAGSAGEFMSRDLTENSTLTMFVPDLCRTVKLDHVESGTMKGLNYHKFEMLSRVFDKSNVTNENNCFCNGECKWSGVMNVSACRFDAPVFLSLPHFLYADPELRNAVEGLSPDPEKHSFYFAVEPTLGVPLDVAGRFQLNIYLQPDISFTPFARVPNMLFPVFWVQQHVVVTDNIFTELRVVVGVFQWGGLFFAITGLILITIFVFCSQRKPKYILVQTR